MAQEWMLKAVLSANAEGMLKTLKAVNLATRSTRKHLMDVASSASNQARNRGVQNAAFRPSPCGAIGCSSLIVSAA